MLVGDTQVILSDTPILVGDTQVILSDTPILVGDTQVIHLFWQVITYFGKRYTKRYTYFSK